MALWSRVEGVWLAGSGCIRYRRVTLVVDVALRDDAAGIGHLQRPAMHVAACVGCEKREFPGRNEIQDFVTDFACYRPGGGEFLYDENAMVKKCEELLTVLRKQAASEG